MMVQLGLSFVCFVLLIFYYYDSSLKDALVKSVLSVYLFAGISTLILLPIPAPWYQITVLFITVFFIVFLSIKLKDQFSIVLIRFKKINHKKYLSFLFLFLILLFQFLSINKNYNGEALDFRNRVHKVESFHFPGPLVSDEYYTIGFVRDILQYRQLPIYKPFTKDREHFINVQLPFHLVVAGLCTLFAVDVEQYIFFRSVQNVILLFLFFSLILKFGFSWWSCFFCTWALSFTTQAPNLFTFWCYLPIHLGAFFLIASLYFTPLKNKYWFYFCNFFTIIFYPPLIVFVFINLIFLNINKKKLAIVFFTYLISLTLMLFLLINVQDFNILTYLKNRMFFYNVWGDVRSLFLPHNILHPLLLLSFLIGLRYIKKYSLSVVVSLVLGSFYWIVYHFTDYRFLNEHDRMVFITCFFIAIISAKGIDCLYLALNRKKIFVTTLLIFFLIHSFNFTRANRWDSLTLYTGRGVESPIQALPIMPIAYNNDFPSIFMPYLHSRKKILSFEWLSLLIATSWNLTIVYAKTGTVSYDQFDYKMFFQSNCEEKKVMLKERSVDLIFLPLLIECPFVKKVAVSNFNNFNLYEVSLN